MSIEEYLSSEVLSEVKREYLAGDVYAMAGASEAHNRIASNLISILHRQLRGRACEAFGSDMKVRLHPLGDTYFYYPDAMIACDPSDVGQAGASGQALCSRSSPKRRGEWTNAKTEKGERGRKGSELTIDTTTMKFAPCGWKARLAKGE